MWQVQVQQVLQGLGFECKIQCDKFKRGKYCKVLVLNVKYSVASLGMANIPKPWF